MSGYVLALDQGTTSSRAILYDDYARPIKMAQKPTKLLTPKAGYVEQDAMQIWYTQLSCAHDVINQAGLLATDISSIAITNQRETTVIWDKQTGKPVAPAIIWQDRRTRDWCDSIRSNATQQMNPSGEQLSDGKHFTEQDIQKITGLRIDPYFSASKIAWLLNHEPDLKEKAHQGLLAFGTVDSWLIFKLTGGQHVIDVSNASRTLLFDIQKLKWSEPLLAYFQIPKNILPTVVASDEDFGKTKKGLFAKQIPVQSALGDQQAALFGQGCHQPGMAKNTYGTGCFMLMNIGATPKLSQHQLLTTVAWQRQSDTNANPATALHGQESSFAKFQNKLIQSSRKILHPTKKETTYALEGSVFMAGAIVQWLRDNLGLFTHSNEIENLAKQVKDSDGVILVPAFTGLGAPYWRPDATASLTGMTRGTTKAHIARAALEAIAFQTYDVLIAMQKDSPYPLTELRVDGGAANNDLLMQFQADLLNVPVLRPQDTEVTAKGAALLAGIKTGLYDEQTIKESWQIAKAFYPSMSADKKEYYLHQWHQAVRKQLTAMDKRE